MANLTAGQVPRLKLKWAFGFPGDVNASAQPTIAAGRVFVGSQGGKVYSLSAATGCVHWWFEAEALVRTAVSIGRIEMPAGPSYAAFFGDTHGTVYAVAAATGKLLGCMSRLRHLKRRQPQRPIMSAVVFAEV